jgi:Methyltransferase domain
MHWRLKGLIQKVLSTVPGGEHLNDGLQKRFGGLRHFEQNIASKVDDWKLSIRYLHDVGCNVRGAIFVEIGTGWYPTLPICFNLIGVERVITYDTVRHMDEALTFHMLAELERHLDSIAEASGISSDEVRDRYRTLLQAKGIDSLLKLAQIEYYAPTDARVTSLVSNSVDLVFSNSVMQQVPKDVIRGLMNESMRILRPGALALHNVGCSDQYAFVDRGISFVNYLQYSEPKWRKWNNSLQYQNRLRASEFLDLAGDAGLEVIYKRTAIRPGTREALFTLKIAAEFERFSREDLAITTIDFVSKKAPS